MLKCILFFILIICSGISNAQVGKKGTTKPVKQSDINKMMDDAMGDMSESEKAAVKKAMGEANVIATQVKQAGGVAQLLPFVTPVIPSKKATVLSKIPSLTTSVAFDNFINARLLDCKKKLPATLIKQVDDYFLQHANNASIVNVAPFFLMQSKPQAAIYAALKLVVLKPNNVILKNNLGVILHQSGYAEMAIPIFEYILNTNSYNEVMNNKAQCYLTLGDKENAKKLFMACLAKNPDNAKALCGMGLLLISEGNIADAAIYIKKSLKNEYSESAESLAEKHKIKMDFAAIKPVVAEYFNPQKYKPVEPATNVYDVEKVQLLRNQFNELTQRWQSKAITISSDQNNKKGAGSIGQMMNNYRGYVFKNPLSKKANFILTQLTQDYYDYNKHNYKMEYELKADNLYKNLENAMETINKERYETRYDDCQKRITAVNSYLALSAQNHKSYQSKTVYKLYDWVNQNLQWKRYLLSASEYNQVMYELVADYFKVANQYSIAQIIYPIPVNIAGQCKDEKPVSIKALAEDSLKVSEEDCPLKIEIPFGMGKAKFGCDGYSIEGGEGIVGSIEKKYSTGEFTIFVGLGIDGYAKGFGIGGIESSATIGSFVTVGKDFTVLDCGNKGEIGVEGGVGAFITEVKLSGTMGMESGINVNTNVLGNETKIFQYGTNN